MNAKSDKNDSLFIRGGTPIEGSFTPSGAKNIALPVLISACLGERASTIRNVPTGMRDVEDVLQILKELGAEVSIEGTTVRCGRGDLGRSTIANADLTSRIRYSLLLPGLAASLQMDLEVSQPGGCSLGTRAYDQHIAGLTSFGHQVDCANGSIFLKNIPRSQNTSYHFNKVTTTGTECLLIAAMRSKFPTKLSNVHLCPFVLEQINFLRKLGADIRVNESSNEVLVSGTDRMMGGVDFRVSGGWDEAITYVVASIITDGHSLSLVDFESRYSGFELKALEKMGVKISVKSGIWTFKAKGRRLEAIDIVAAEYPSFASDIQPIFAPLIAKAHGVSSITDLRFGNARLAYLNELYKLGIHSEVQQNRATVTGPLVFRSSSELSCQDLRCGAALVIAAMAAKGISRLKGLGVISRGYPDLIRNLNSLGAEITGSDTTLEEHKVALEQLPTETQQLKHWRLQ